MASLSWVAPDLVLRGPVVGAFIAVSTPVEVMLRAGRLPVPTPVEVTALVDTGAYCSAIDGETVARLGLLPVSAEPVSMPGPVARTVPTLRYAVRIFLPDLAAFEITVIRAQVHGDFQAVLGRDILASAVLVYVGTTGQCTIAF